MLVLQLIIMLSAAFHSIINHYQSSILSVHRHLFLILVCYPSSSPNKLNLDDLKLRCVDREDDVVVFVFGYRDIAVLAPIPKLAPRCFVL